MKKFQCKKCKTIFEDKGKKIEEMNQIYGKVWKWQAKHKCGEICQEYFPPKVKTKKKNETICTGNCHACPFH